MNNTQFDQANRLFFRLYQCSNMLHKTGTRAVEDNGLTTQQWAVLGALSRDSVSDGMSVGALAKYLKVSRQNLAGVLSRMERNDHVALGADAHDGRARRVRLTRVGTLVWSKHAQPNIRAYYSQALAGFSANDVTHALHYLLKMLENMERIDQGADADASAD
jgi:DNA-binding MarR family transcriptional regulator